MKASQCLSPSPDEGGEFSGVSSEPIPGDSVWEVGESVAESGQCNHFKEHYVPHWVERQATSTREVCPELGKQG